MAKPQAIGALMTILVVLATSAETAHGICNLSSNGIRACQPAAAIRNPTDQPSAACCAALAGADLPCLYMPVQERRRRVGEVLQDRHQPRHGAARQMRPNHAGQLLMIPSIVLLSASLLVTTTLYI